MAKKFRESNVFTKKVFTEYFSFFYTKVHREVEKRPILKAQNVALDKKQNPQPMIMSKKQF